MKIEWHVGDVIRKLRESVELTQEQLAKRSGMNRGATIGGIENSGNCHHRTLKKIAIGLGIKDSDILALIPGNEPAPPRMLPSVGLCPTNESHRKYQIMLDEIFHENEQRGEWIRGNVITFHERLFGPSNGGREVDNIPHNPFGFDRMPSPASKKKGKKIV